MSDEQRRPARRSRRGEPCASCGQPIDHDWQTTSYCATCHRARRRAAQATYRQEHREQVNAYNRDWLRAHPEVNAANQARTRARRRRAQGEE